MHKGIISFPGVHHPFIHSLKLSVGRRASYDTYIAPGREPEIGRFYAGFKTRVKSTLKCSVKMEWNVE